MATVSITLQARDEATSQIQALRKRMAELNRTILENKNALVGASAEEKRRLRALNETHNAAKAQIRNEIEMLNLQKQAIATTMRATRERQKAARAQVKASEEVRAAQQQIVAGASVASGVLSYQLGQLTRGFIESAANIETFRATINAVTRDGAETDRILQRLLETSVELVGIDTGVLIQYAARLMATGLSADQAITAITGVTRRMAEQARPASETALAMEQVAQSFNTGRAVMFDFRTLMRLFPTLWDDITAALGENVRSTEDFNRVAAASGGHSQALLRVLTQMNEQSQGADLSTLNAQLDILRDQSIVLASEIGEHLIPAVVGIIRQVNEWIEKFRTMDDRAQAAIAWAAALATGITGLSAVVGGAVVAFGALNVSLATITGASGFAGVVSIGGRAAGVLGRTVGVLGRVTSVGGLAATALTTLVEAWRQIYNAFNQNRPFEDAVETIQELDVAASQTAKSLGITAESLGRASDESRQQIELLISRADELRTSIRNSVNSGDTAALSEFRKEYRAILSELEFLTAQIPETAQATEELSETIAVQLVRARDQVLRLRDAFKEASKSNDVDAIQDAASNLTTALEKELELQLQNTKLTTEKELELQLNHARTVESINKEAEEKITEIGEENAKRRTETTQRQTDARIESAERARAAEVEGYKRAAQSGEEYAAQLKKLINVDARRDFDELVQSLQGQGLSFDEARTEAAKYIDILNATNLTSAEQQFDNFTSRLIRQTDESADAVINLVNAVGLLGQTIGQTFDRDGTFIGFGDLNEQRYFDQNPIGLTLEADQQRAGEQGREFLLRSFGQGFQDVSREFDVDFTEVVRQIESQGVAFGDALQQARGYFSELEEQSEANQDLAEAAGVIDAVGAGLGRLTGRFEGVGDAADTAAGLAIDAARVAAGDWTALIDIGVSAINFISDAEEEAHQRRLERQAEFEESILSVYELQRTFAQDANLQNVFSGEISQFFQPSTNVASSRGVQELAQSGIITQAPVTPSSTFDLQGFIENTDFSDVLGAGAEARIISDVFINQASVADAFQPFLRDFRLAMEFAGEDFRSAIERGDTTAVLTERFNEYIQAINDDYDLRIDQEKAAGTLTANAREEYERNRANALNEARNLFAGASGSYSIGGSSVTVSTRAERAVDAQRQDYFDQGGGLTPAESIEPILTSINEGIELINASILSVNTQIDQSNDPAEIAQLLSRVPALISEKYEMLRQALEARFNAGEISEAVYNASLSELQSNESRELEQHSDAVLANTLRTLNEDVQLIDASISSIQTQIDGLSEPEVIVGLLNQLPALITEKYQKLREALDEKYAAGEISVDVYNASLTALATTEASETERHSDAVLAQTLADIDDDVELIDANIGALQLAVENSDDPESIAGLLDAIKLLVADKYKHLRERLDELYAAEEISTDSYNAALTGLSTAESRALADLDTQALNAISTEAQEQANFINGAIENLRLSLQLTDDPAETQRILDAIRVLTASRFDVLIEELNAIKDTLTDDQFNQALTGLELGKQVALENIDTEKFDAISTEAASQVDFINGSIENLRLSLQLTDDPAEAQQIIDAIKVLTASRFQVLRDELNAIKDTLKPEEFQQALKGINLGEQLALENLDTEKFDVISAAAEAQVDFINTDIELLRVSLQLADDPAQRQEILDAIRVLTQARFDILREELENIRESLKPEEYDQALRGLNLGEQLALENIDTEKFDEISAAAAEQVSFINKDIENLRLAFELADDPTERQAILDTIKILTRARFDILREELEAIRERLKPEEYAQALKGLNLSETLALENIDTEKFGVISQAAQKQVDFVNGAIGNLELALQLTDDPAEITAILTSIRTLTAKRFEILIAELKAIEESFDDPAEFAQALEGLQLGSQVALRGIDTRISEVGIGQIGIAIGAVDSEIQQLFDDLSEQTTASGIREAIARLRAAITSRFELERDRINQSADSEEEKARQLKALNTQESQQLSQLGERGISQFSSLVDTAQFLLDTATEAEFTTRRQELVDAINRFYDERTAFINNQDLSDTDRQNMLAVADIQRNIALQAIPQMHESVTERLEMEKRVQDQIQDLRDDSLDAEREHADDIVAINQRAEEKITDIKARAIEERLEAERRANRSREDIETDFSRDIEDILRDAGADESLFRHGDFQELVRLATIAPNQSFLQDRLQGLGLDLDEGQLERISELARERGRDLQDVDRDTQRRQQDIARRERDTLTRAEADRNSAIVLSNQRLAETQENLSTAIRELQGALTGGEGQGELIQKQSDAADKQSTAADKQTTAAGMQSEASTKLGETADAQSDNAITEAENAKLFQTAGKEHLQAAKELKDAARAQGLIEAAGALKAAASEIVKGMQDAFRGISALAEDFSEALGTIAAGRLEIALPEGFKPQTAAEDLSAIEERINASEPIPVNVVNPNEIAATPSLLALQGEIAQLRSEGLNNREIGQLLREDINALQESGVSRQDIRSAIRGEVMQRPLIEPVLGTPQTTPIASPPEPNALQAAGGASVSSVSITAQSVSVSGPIQGSLGQQSGDTVIRVENIIELDGDKVAENTENHIVTRRGEGRSLL